MSFNISGIFSYEEAKKIYRSQDTKCEKDSDCLDGSYCDSSNECRFNGYCSESDMNRCALQKILLNQCTYNDYDCKLQYENKTIECYQNDDCLSNKCNNNTCIGRIYEFYMIHGEDDYGIPRGGECNKKTICSYGGKCRDGFCGPADLFPEWVGFTIIGGFGLVCIVLFGLLVHVFIKKLKSK